MQSLHLERILVAVADPAARRNAAVKRAAELAHRTGASVELFNALRLPGLADGLGGFGSQLLVTAIEANRAALDRMARPLRREEIRVETTVQHAEVVHEAILRRARRMEADLIIIEERKHGQFARALLRQTDFELIRRSPVPLLIVKGTKAWRAPRVLAAIDPFHAHDKPRALDARIVAAAGGFAKTLGGALHAAYVYWPLAESFPNVVIEPTVMAVTPAQVKTYESELRKRFGQSVGEYGIGPKNRHLRRGDPALELELLVRALKIRLLVMGAVSRSGLKQLFIGHTAERVLDNVSCDVLIVKP